MKEKDLYFMYFSLSFFFFRRLVCSPLFALLCARVCLLCARICKSLCMISISETLSGLYTFPKEKAREGKKEKKEKVISQVLPVNIHLLSFIKKHDRLNKIPRSNISNSASDRLQIHNMTKGDILIHQSLTYSRLNHSVFTGLDHIRKT